MIRSQTRGVLQRRHGSHDGIQGDRRALSRSTGDARGGRIPSRVGRHPSRPENALKAAALLGNGPFLPYWARSARDACLGPTAEALLELGPKAGAAYASPRRTGGTGERGRRRAGGASSTPPRGSPNPTLPWRSPCRRTPGRSTSYFPRLRQVCAPVSATRPLPVCPLTPCPGAGRRTSRAWATALPHPVITSLQHRGLFRRGLGENGRGGAWATSLFGLARRDCCVAGPWAFGAPFA